MNLAEALNYKWGKNRKESDEHIEDIKCMFEVIFRTTLQGENEVGWYVSHPLLKDFKKEYIEMMKELGFKVSITKEELGECIHIEW